MRLTAEAQGANMTGSGIFMRGAATLLCATVFFVATDSHSQAPPRVRLPAPVNRPPPPPPPPAPPVAAHAPVMYTAVTFTVWTGGDDLRANSTAGADLHFADGTTTHCDLRPGNDSWDNTSVHSAPACELPRAMRLGQLKTVKIDLVYSGDPHAAVNQKKGAYEFNFDTFDNWDVNRVRVVAQNPVQHQEICVADVKGDPLVRLKETNTSFRITDAMRSC